MASGSHRLGTGGRIDRSRAIAFTLEGRRLQGFGGDTLAAALLAEGVSLLGRSFKYHRPRGLLAAGVEEPNGLVTLGKGGGRTPNVPATTVELHEGIVACRQNGWPSVEVDVMAALTACATPLLGAGFYYKTFMGPRRGSWMLYEPYIRRAAGLGQGTHTPDPDRYETRHAFTDVLVIGAGPAGLAAARAAAAAGARVMLIEQDFALGGSLLGVRADSPLEPWRVVLEAELRAMPNLSIGLRTTALGVYDGNTLALLERHDHARADASRGGAREVLVTLRTRAIVYATGATERPLVFADNDRPGVMLSSAVRTYLNRYAVAAGRRAVLATNNDSAYAAALDLAAAGVKVTVLDERAKAGAGMVEVTRGAGVEVRSAVRVARALGGRALEAVEFEALEGGRTERLDADLLGMSGGWSPVVHLTSHTGRKPIYCAALDSFVPGGYAAGHFAAGALTGSLTLSAALAEGREAGQAAAAHAGCSRTAGAAPAAPVPDEPVGFEASPPRPLKRRGKAFVDFQNDVTTDDIALAHEEGYVSVEHLKRYTTLGMGTDQGKTSNVNAALWMAALRGVELPAAGTTTYRPPYTPVSIGALAGRHTGARFRPTRRSPLHDWHVANGAVMIEAGAWLRPWYYRWAGDSAAAAYLEEMRLVRGGVGVSDVSTLGKIDVQGPDAAEFLNRVYVNGFAKLPIGKARYGVMLNDDATVLDDGTTARFGETRFFLTTTTAQAAEVMSWLEFLLQTAWTDLRVQVVSVTDRWAGMSVAGPQARAALELAFPDLDVSNTALPHMGVLEVQVDGVPLRLLRLSFSGELAYELYVPADRGVALWERLLGRAAPLGLKSYGLEALASLRIEKGHVAGLELDHRNTLDDLGLGKMAASTKHYVGRELRERADLRAAERWSLVGLECLDPNARLRGGAILFARGEAIAGHGRGYITSVTWSTVLDKYIALGLYQDGLKHAGEEIVCAYPLKGETVRARVVQPVFVDPAGERLHV
jgi:heterotetrameric sarcosine oxidase alpha subunit